MIYLLIIRQRTDAGTWRKLRWDSPVLCIGREELDKALLQWTTPSRRVEVRTFSRWQVRDLLEAA